jgi:hypothetical protein
MTGALDKDHQCFGCGRLVADHEEHLHLTMDEWAVRKGEEPLGMDDLFRFVFCSHCIQKTDDGWESEAHEIERGWDEIRSWLND